MKSTNQNYEKLTTEDVSLAEILKNIVDFTKRHIFKY
jgi:hypothetical protein